MWALTGRQCKWQSNCWHSAYVENNTGSGIVFMRWSFAVLGAKQPYGINVVEAGENQCRRYGSGHLFCKEIVWYVPKSQLYGIWRHVSCLKTVSRHGFSCLGLGSLSTLVRFLIGPVFSSFLVSPCLMSLWGIAISAYILCWNTGISC